MNVFGSLLAQLCNINTSLWVDVDARYREELNKGLISPARLNLSETESMLGTACKKLPNVHVFLDALNKSNESTSIVATLWNLVKENEKLRIMVSSTEELYMSFEQPAPSPLLAVYLASSLVDEDIRAYVEYSLEHNEGLRNLPIPLRDSIKHKLLSRSNGM